jgi:hypothetical protein
MIAHFGQFFDNYKRSQVCLATFSHNYGYAFMYFGKNGLGYILDDFFTILSGHPVA